MGLKTKAGFWSINKMKENIICTPSPELILTQKEQLKIIEIFNEVRDIHFDCDVTTEKPRDVESSIELLQKIGRGACSPKHYLLGKKLENLGLDVNYLSFPFKWDNLGVAFPEDLQVLSFQVPIQYHLSLGLTFDRYSCLLDATWDQRLKKYGFRVNEIPFLPSHNVLGVQPCGEPVIHRTAQERWNYILSLKKTMLRNDVVPVFYERLNQWLRSLRN